jgi:cytochrome c oxidase subunit I
VINTQRKPKGLEDEDPWDGRTLEWATSSPPAPHNFDEIPTVHALDEFWHRKYVEDKSGRLVRVPAGAAPGAESAHEPHGIHLPSPSSWPITAAVGLPMLAYGAIYSWWLVGLGALIMVVSFTAWAIEPSVAED